MPEMIVMKEIKISKIFHLLYATLLLAPVFAVGVTCAQTAFTGNGFVAEPQDVYTDNVQLTQNDFKAGVWYSLDSSSMGDIDFYICDVLFKDNAPEAQYTYVRDLEVLSFEFDTVLQKEKVQFQSYNVILGDYFELENWALFAFRFKKGYDNYNDIFFHTKKDSGTLLEYLPVIGEAKGYQDIFYTSVDTVSQSPFFNWAQKSFIGDGFRYMGNIFGMPTDNPFYTFTCYWCSISILWLIFDVVMYVPKLAHRWLDKGAIE